MKVPLEDNYEDVLGKACRGLGIDAGVLAERAGVSGEAVERVLGGEFDAGVVRAVSEPLGLAGDRVVALGERSYVAEPVALEGVLVVNTPFEDMTVNAYLVWDPVRRVAAIFDTGSDGSELLAAAAERELTVEQIFVTHSHGDHIFDLDRMAEQTGAKVWTPVDEPVDGAEGFEPGREFAIGDLTVETRLTWGHAKGGVTYVIRGLDRDVAVCGDAIFAGSMGGGAVSWADALRTNREEIFTLADTTLLCPGHGPMTTVGEQRKVNPFFPDA